MKYYASVLLLAVLWVHGDDVVSATVSCQSGSGEYLVISENFTQKVVPGGDQTRAQQYGLKLQLPQLCGSVAGTCKMLVVNRDKGEKHVWAPNTGNAQYHKLVGPNNQSRDTSVLSSVPLHAQNCINYFPVADQVIGAICIRATQDELLVVPYTMEYASSDDVRDNKLGVERHIDPSRHSAFTHLFNDRGRVVLYITYAEHLTAYKLVIIRFHSKDDVVVDIPPDCVPPHDLQRNGERDAIIKCANGKVYYFNGNNLVLTKLPYEGVIIVSNCINSMSFVSALSADYFIFNRSNDVYIISVNTTGLKPLPQTVSSAVCYANDNDNKLYFTSAESSFIYQVDLTDTTSGIREQFTLPQVLPGNSQSNGPIHLHIDGPVLWVELSLSLDTTTTGVYLFDVLTQQPSQAAVSGSPVLVQLYTAEQCSNDTAPLVKKVEESSGRISNYVIYILVGAAIFVIAIVVIVVGAVYWKYRRRRRGSFAIINHGPDSYELQGRSVLGIGTPMDDLTVNQSSADFSSAPLLVEAGRHTPSSSDNSTPQDSDDETSPSHSPDRPVQVVNPRAKSEYAFPKWKVTKV